MTGISERAVRLPDPRLRPYVRSYDGYRMADFPAGTHIGMPSTDLTVIITIDEPIHMGSSPHPDQGAGSWDALASGLTSTPCTIVHNGSQHGIQLALTPLGSRVLLGVPTAAIGSWLVGLDEILGSAALELRERITGLPSWELRFDVLDEVFLRRVAALRDDVTLDAPLERAWQLLTSDAGSMRVAEVADDIGWSRRHLVNRFAGEFGITPKDAARIARFSASHQLMRRVELPSIAEISAVCGYYDQAHMARDWRELAGMPPSRWRAAETFAFVQDEDVDRVPHLSA